MASNRGVVYIKPGEVQVESIDFPKLVDPTNGKNDRAWRASSRSSRPTSAAPISTWSAAEPPRPAGLVLGHEITGEVIEAGRDVLVHQEGRYRLACPSTSPAGDAAIARKAEPASA